MLDRSIAAEVLARAVKTGGDFAEIFLEDNVHSYLSMKSDRIEAVGTAREHGAGIRVFEGTKAIYVYTNDTSREGLLDCAAQAAAAVRGGKGCAPVGFSHWSAARPEESGSFLEMPPPPGKRSGCGRPTLPQGLFPPKSYR